MDSATLNQIAEQIMAKLPTDKDRQAVEKVLDGAVKILYGTPEAQKQTKEFIESVKSPDDIIAGVVTTLFVLYKKSNNTMPWGPAIAAGQILLLEGLAEAADAGKLQLDEKVVADTTKKFIDTILAKLGVSAEQLIDVAKKAAVLGQSGTMQAAAQGGAPQGGGML